MRFSIGTVLSITHGNLLTDMDDVYKILNYMLDENLFTHQLPRAGRFCEPFILAQYPQLEQWDVFKPLITTENWEIYIEKAKELFGEELEINKVSAGVWTEKDPMQELEEMVGKEKIIVADFSSEETK